MPFLLFLGNDMKSIQLFSLVALLALVPASAQAETATGRNYSGYRGSVGGAGTTSAAPTTAAPVTAAPATATGVAAPAAVAPGQLVAQPATTSTPAAAVTPQTVPPVFKDTQGAAPAATTAAPAEGAPADPCASSMYDNNAYQTCKDYMLKIERMRAGSKARNANYQAQTAPAAAAPATAAPAPAATPAPAAAPEAAPAAAPATEGTAERPTKDAIPDAPAATPAATPAQ